MQFIQVKVQSFGVCVTAKQLLVDVVDQFFVFEGTEPILEFLGSAEGVDDRGEITALAFQLVRPEFDPTGVARSAVVGHVHFLDLRLEVLGHAHQSHQHADQSQE